MPFTPALIGLLFVLGGLGAAESRAAGPLGIAYVEAPERATGLCTGNTPEQAFTCARELCAVGGVKPRECLRRAWCFPAGWSAEVFIQDANGLHWHEFSCGLDSEQMARRLAELRCDRELRSRIEVCELVRLLDPTGQEVER